MKKTKKPSLVRRILTSHITTKILLGAIALSAGLGGGYKYALKKYNPETAYATFINISSRAVFVGCANGILAAVGPAEFEKNVKEIEAACVGMATQARGEIQDQISMEDLYKDLSDEAGN